VSREVLGRALRERFGYENPSGDIFTLGVRPEHDREFARTGQLFARKQ
jgi:hypothetical protein